MVDTRDCYVLAFESVMLLQWPISSKISFFFIIATVYVNDLRNKLLVN